VNTYGTATMLYQRSGLSLHYAQAHNDYLQLAADGGLLVVLPAAVALATFAAVARSRFAQTNNRAIDWLRVGAVCGIVSVGLQELVDFSLQIPANAALFAVLCGMAIRRPETK
jgi:O-antigen ligase